MSFFVLLNTPASRHGLPIKMFMISDYDLCQIDDGLAIRQMTRDPQPKIYPPPLHRKDINTMSHLLMVSHLASGHGPTLHRRDSCRVHYGTLD